MKEIRNCLYCGKETTNQSYCSNRCTGFAKGHIGGKACVKTSHETNKRNHTGFCWDKKLQEKGRVKGIETNRKNRTGFFDPKIQSQGGKIGAMVNRINGTGIFGMTHEQHVEAGKVGGKLGGKNSAEINRKLKKSCFFNKEIQSRAGKIGGVKAMETIRKNQPYIFKEVHFMSGEEVLVADYLLNKPVSNFNCNIRLKGAIIDFFPQESDKLFINKFVEYHPWDRFGLTIQEYYKKRRKVLDDNGYSNELIVITHLYFKDKKVIRIKFYKE